MKVKGPRPPFSRRGEQAIRAFQEANSLDAILRLSHADDVVQGAEARRARGRAEILLERTAPVVVGAGEAISWDNQPDEIFKGAHAGIVETLEHPNTVSAGASGDRLSPALGAGVLEPAIDAAVSAQARNSLEKMLCHQMAGAHFTAMHLLEQSASQRYLKFERTRTAPSSPPLCQSQLSVCSGQPTFERGSSWPSRLCGSRP